MKKVLNGDSTGCKQRFKTQSAALPGSNTEKARYFTITSFRLEHLQVLHTVRIVPFPRCLCPA